MMARYEILEHALHRARWSWGDDWESAACDVVFETSDQAAAWSDYAARSPRDMFEVEARTRGGYGRMRDAGYRVELLRIWTSDPTSEEADAETVASWEWTYDDHMREEREAGEMADYRDIEREALEYMGEHAGDWDVDAVVREVMGMGAGSIDELDPDEWTGILQRHDGEGPGAGKVFDDAGCAIMSTNVR